MTLCTDLVRVKAQARYEKEVTPEAAAKATLPRGCFEFTHLTYNEEASMDTIKPIKIAHSYTSIDTYNTCPKQYHAKYVTKEVKFQPTEATLYGDRMHKSMETRLRYQTALPEEFAGLEATARSIEAIQGELRVEEPLAITRDWAPTTFFGSNVWVRGKGDVTIYNKDKQRLFVFDWKTGKPVKDMLQLEMMAMLGVRRYPAAQEVRAVFVYTKTGDIEKEKFSIDDIKAIEQKVEQKIIRIETAHEKNLFPPQPNGLCKSWCQVTSCQFHGKGRYG